LGRPSKYGDETVTVPSDVSKAERDRLRRHNSYIRNKEKQKAKARLYYRCMKDHMNSKKQEYVWENIYDGYAAPPEVPLEEGDPKAIKKYLKGLEAYRKGCKKIDRLFAEESECEDTD